MMKLLSCRYSMDTDRVEARFEDGITLLMCISEKVSPIYIFTFCSNFFRLNKQLKNSVFTFSYFQSLSANANPHRRTNTKFRILISIPINLSIYIYTVRISKSRRFSSFIRRS